MPVVATSPLAEARSLHAVGQLLEAAEHYRATLAAEPGNLPALLGLSLIARQTGQALPALRMGLAAVEADPQSALAHTTVAHAYVAMQERGEAERHLREALRLNPYEVAALLAMGDLLTAEGKAGLASTQYHRALAIRPNLAQAHFGLGNVLALEEKYAAALVSFQRALALKSEDKPDEPKMPEANQAQRHFAIGYVYSKLGEHAQAIHHYREAVVLQPGFASAWLNLGVELVADGRDVLAELSYKQALEANPKLVSAWLNLGNLERARHRFAEAAAHYERAQELAPGDSNVLVAFAYLYMESGRYEEARRALQWADACDAVGEGGIAGVHRFSEKLGGMEAGLECGQEAEACAAEESGLNPKETAEAVVAVPLAWKEGARNAEIANARGILLMSETAGEFDGGKLGAAVEAFREAERLGHRTAASNRGNALLRLGRVREAMAAHQAAVMQDSTHAGARYNLALTQLRLGDFAHGWANYEARWRFREVHPRPRRFAEPRWKGELLLKRPARERRLLVYAEQGLGDTVQFVRYLPKVAAMGAEIVLEVQAPLVRLVEPLVKALGGVVVAQGEPLPGFDLHCPLMSMPAVSLTTVETVPAPIPYLRAEAERTKERAAELGLDRGGRRIGLAWAGNRLYRADKERSTKLETLLPLVREFAGFGFVSLQKGEAAGELAGVPADPRVADGCSGDRDLADAAAVIANLDLVITTDTVIAHLAGAMGKPLWLLLPWQADWRWMQERETTPWYPQARLFRQRAPGDWAELVWRVAGALRRQRFGQ